MKEFIFNFIFILGTIILVLFLIYLILIFLNKIYGVLVRCKFKTPTSAMEFLAKKGMECEKICKIIILLRERRENEGD